MTPPAIAPALLPGVAAGDELGKTLARGVDVGEGPGLGVDDTVGVDPWHTVMGTANPQS
jgi:hypothetical protein